MNVQSINFDTFKDHINKQGQEGIILFGAGGDLLEWVFGVTDILHQTGIINHNDYTKAWEEIFVLKTSGGRSDLALTFNPKTNFDLSKMAIWRLNFGECSWISDYIPNYANQHQI